MTITLAYAVKNAATTATAHAARAAEKHPATAAGMEANAALNHAHVRIDAIPAAKKTVNAAR